ncbi:DUF21 domain-containing protein [Chloropicon primus]|uniref:DUF21 domain-containing protein n=1 Tax=Chloropicon primus TaxID=1764295 RepID=A0A5B8MHC9_9CHLO|nr:DUF21 domain-containing protein [Chloropicon primus]UPQ98903.1 DUF21 domain-containing protein [Chloropicon primus]|eukprot:QDZ19691.1 DUF21 domain-containing protein [Chloropicon primus]
MDWYYPVISAALVLLSGLFSGLTLGLLSLDTTNLEVLQEAGDETEQKYAKVIRPLRKTGNLLLCTLLLGNTLVNTLLSIMLASILNSWQGFVSSTFLILIFGEIIPQATCSKYGLMVGARTIYLTKFFMAILLPLTYPISWGLDRLLGQEIGILYNRSELKRLIEIHVQNQDVSEQGGMLDAEDQVMLTGVLDYKQKVVNDVMTKLEKVFMIDVQTRLSFETILDIYKSGYTRIPVYEKSRDNVVGILYAKDLILVDPSDEVEVRTILAFHEKKVIKVLDTTPLNIVFRMFKTSFVHLLVAVHLDENKDMWIQNVDKMNHTLQCPQRVVGIITLEDVLEEVIKAEIVDESDRFTDNLQNTLVPSKRRKGMQRYLELFSYRSNVGVQLSENERDAVRLFLVECCPDFATFSKSSRALLKYIEDSQVVEMTEEQLQGHGDLGYCLFTKGAPSDEVMIMLAGTVEVTSGKESFKTSLGPWSILGSNMLSSIRSKTYITDFTAYVKSDYCRILKLNRTKYYMLLDKEKESDRNLTLSQLQERGIPEGEAPDESDMEDVQVDLFRRSSSEREENDRL